MKIGSDIFALKADFLHWRCYEGPAKRWGMIPERPAFHSLDSRVGTGFPKKIVLKQAGPVAQLDRVADFYSAGCRFESCRDRHRL
jgi:hypothetical protein